MNSRSNLELVVLDHYQRRNGERPDEYAARMIVETNCPWTLKVIDDGKSGDGLVDYEIIDNGKPAGAFGVGGKTEATQKANSPRGQRGEPRPPEYPGLKGPGLLGGDPKQRGFKQTLN